MILKDEKYMMKNFILLLIKKDVRNVKKYRKKMYMCNNYNVSLYVVPYKPK